MTLSHSLRCKHSVASACGTASHANILAPPISGSDAFAVFWIFVAARRAGPAVAIGAASALGARLRWRRARPREFRIIGGRRAGALRAIGAFALGRPRSPPPKPSRFPSPGSASSRSPASRCGDPGPPNIRASPMRRGEEPDLFLLVNMAISALWGACSSRSAAFCAWLGRPGRRRRLVGAGVLASIFGPKLLIRLAMRRQIRQTETYRWRARFRARGRRGTSTSPWSAPASAASPPRRCSPTPG